MKRGEVYKMDKNTYETYEFLPSNATEAEPDQFFVVQDDGTFLLNRQIQYVAQVQDVKEVLEDVQPCTVYGVGVSSQQFFVDVDNSAELISVSDQFILPEGDNGLYTNSYLLQPSTSTATEQMEEDVVADQFKQPSTQDLDIDIATYNCKQENNFTEITLSDEQYRTLEQKGWILLECNDKIFVLNTLGLHDITTNDKLIQKLKNEIQNSTTIEPESGTVKEENVSAQYPNLVAQSFTNQQDTVEFVIGSNEEQDDTMDNLQFVISENEKENSEVVATPVNTKEPMYVCDSSQDKQVILNTDEIATVKQDPQNNPGALKIKTKLNFKDIPETIELGQTVNGKRLVAKVVKSLLNRSNHIKPPEPDENTQFTIACEKVIETYQQKATPTPTHTVAQPYSNMDVKLYPYLGISEAELLCLISREVRAPHNVCAADHVASAHSVIAQLLQVPNLKSSLLGHKLIITKAQNCKNELGEVYNKSDVAVVTGRVTDDEDSSATFEHLPDMLQSMKSSAEEAKTSENQHLECIDHEKDICTLFHVHITESKCSDNVVRVSVTLNKRQLSLNQMFDVKKRHLNKVFGCSACAALFKSEEALKEHQDKDCLDTDEMLTIDMDKKDMVDAYAMIKTEPDKTYSCKQCNAKFQRIYYCLRHVKTHLGLHLPKSETDNDKETSNEEPSNDGTQKKLGKDVYKCKMCCSTYFHPATLSKHIVARHIKCKSK